MRRSVAVGAHIAVLAVAAALFYFFVLPRWNELTGEVSHGLGTAMRIVTGVLIGLNALPVFFTLLRSRPPELGTPQLALRLRMWSIVLHLVAAVLIVGAAISEVWLDPGTAGQWLFGIYGAAAAITLLGAAACYVAFAAELPPPPPKPVKPKAEQTRRRGRRPAPAEPQSDEPQETQESPEPQESDDEPETVTEAPAADDDSSVAELTVEAPATR